jgi:hypothetical protein
MTPKEERKAEQILRSIYAVNHGCLISEREVAGRVIPKGGRAKKVLCDVCSDMIKFHLQELRAANDSHARKR